MDTLGPKFFACNTLRGFPFLRDKNVLVWTAIVLSLQASLIQGVF